jgi:hypothetical protein
LKQLQRVLGSVSPSSLHGLVANLASDLAGQGSQLRQLISSASGTLQLLAEKGNELGQMNGSLAQLTGTLRANESQLLDLLQQFEVVSNVIAGHQQELGASIDDLSRMGAQLAALLSPNLKPLEQDVSVITTAGRTLDRNLANLDSIMSSSSALFSAAHRAYDPVHHWLNLNNQLAPGLTASVLEGLVRDRLAGICRRVLAHHSAGLSPPQKATLARCGNPDSGYFDPILAIVPEIIQKGGLDNPGASPSTSASTLLGPGLAKIPGLTKAEKSSISSGNSPESTSTSSSGTSPASGSSANEPSKCSGVDGAINCVLGPLPPLSSSSTASGGASAGSSGSSGGGLLGVVFGAISVSGQVFRGIW